MPHSRRSHITRLWHHFWSPPERMFLDAGGSGELAVAEIRILVTAILLLIPIGEMALSMDAREVSMDFAIGASGVIVALAIYAIVRGTRYRRWIGIATSVMDVSMVTFALASFLLIGQPSTAVSSKVVFDVYFLAIAATALRYDPRVCALTGVVAMVEYAALVLFTSTHWPLNDPQFAPVPSGVFSWSAQAARVLLLACASGISTVGVLRSQRLRWLSASDPLTELMNRGHFDERVEEEEIRTKRYRRPLCIAMCDIDHFKQFNDTYGHASGDEALRIVAKTLRASLRRTDLVARYGGEEFVIAMPETTLAAGLTKCEEIRSAVEQARVLLRGSRGVTGVTVSLGVAAWPDDGDDVPAVVERADRRLYTAKQSGRNQVVGPRHGAEPQVRES